MFEKDGDTVPVRLLENKFRVRNSLIFPSTDGMGPVSELPFKHRYSMLVRLPSAVGIRPLNELSYKYKYFKSITK